MPKGNSIQSQLIVESKQAALNAIQTFNNPLATFKTETFIVLMVIAWRSLLHAYYRGINVEYRYFDRKNRNSSFMRTKSGAFRYWDLEKCLQYKNCPLDEPTKKNLRFLIGLRNEIEHHQSTGVDEYFTGRYLACCLNYERVLTELFGDQHSVGSQMAYALQFRDLTAAPSPDESINPLPNNVINYMSTFDADISEDDYQHPHFSYQMIFVRKLTNNRNTTDQAIEFISADSELASGINKQYWVQKEVERPKYRPSQIVGLMAEEGYPQFNMHQHTLLWKERDAKNLGKGYGVEVSGQWYWYDKWIAVVREHCKNNASQYRNSADKTTLILN